MGLPRDGRLRRTLRKIALSATIIFGFVSIIFSRDFDGAGHLFHEPKDEGIAHADAPGYTDTTAAPGDSSSSSGYGTGDSSSGSTGSDCGDGSGGGGGG